MAKYFIAMFKNNPSIILFLFCPGWQIVKQVPSTFAQLTPKLLDSFSCPYHWIMPKFNSICLVNIPEQIFGSSCLREVIVKEVQARHIQMSWNFARIFIWSNNESPPNMISCNSTMWAQLQILVSGQIFSLWSNYILYCFNWAENLPGHASTHIHSLHQVLPQLVNPIALCNFSKILSKMKLCEASATLVFPNGMKSLQHLHIIT